MKIERLPLTASYMVIVVIFVCLTACKGGGNDHPSSSLQRTLASIVSDTKACPTGDSLDVQLVIDHADFDGIARLAEGCYRISSTIRIPACTQLRGAGTDKTILYRDPAGNFSQPIFTISGSPEATCTTQISGISFLGVLDTEDTGQDYGVRLTNIKDFRIDHCYFEGFGFAGVRVEGDSDGVIDHAIFVDNFKRGIDNLGYGVVVYGTGNWIEDLQPGGADATFVEDSLFVGNRHAIAANAGAHYVFRNNQVMQGVEACGVDAHGMGYGSVHGTQYVEIYHNTIEDPIYDWCGIGIRGGAGVIFENTIQGYKNPILLILEWGTPDRLKAEYPAFEQVQELYIWDNQIKGGSSNPQIDETGVGFIELGRDYFVEPKPGYVPYEYPHPLVRADTFDINP